MATIINGRKYFMFSNPTLTGSFFAVNHSCIDGHQTTSVSTLRNEGVLSYYAFMFWILQ
ncbi:MAG TPA: hypothetical protein PLS00_01405 [Niabella sp.]|nr:hypothetical protein [Chitinophagaceae bacterium]HUN01483.1 hypothetical protein [Niabella sp.]